MKRAISAVAAFSLLFLIICKMSSTVIVLAAKSDPADDVYIAEAVEASVSPPTKAIEISVPPSSASESEAFYIEQISLSEELQKYIYDLCKERNISYDLILAVIKRESNFNVNSIGYNDNGSYDSGLMQINSCHLESIEDTYGFTDIMNPYNNVLVGIDMLSENINEYGEVGGLMAYNLGSGGYEDAVAAGINSTSYSDQVLAYKSEIEAMNKV